MALVLGGAMVPPAVAQVSSSLLPPAPNQVTLADAITMADRVQPTVVQAEATTRNASAQKKAATGAFLPSLSTSANGNTFYSEGVGRVDPITGEFIVGDTRSTSINFGLSASLDVFTGLRRQSDLKAANAQENAAGSGLIDARYQQRLGTTNQFFAALGNAQLVKVREASVRRAEEQLKVSVAKLRAGTATRSDSLRSMVTLGNAQLDLVNALAAQAGAEATLGQVIGVQGRVAAQDDSSFYTITDTLDIASLEAEAELRSPQVQTAEASAQAARAQVNSVKAQYWPSLVLTGQWNYNGSTRNDYELFNQKQLNLGLNWPIFNRFIRERNVTSQEGTAQVAEANAANTRRQVGASLIAQAAQLRASVVRIGITQTSLAAAQEDLRVQQERYRLGVATILDVLTSQEALSQAEVNVLAARYDYLRAKAQIEALIGRPL